MEEENKDYTGGQSFFKFMVTKLNEMLFALILHVSVGLGFYYTFEGGIDSFYNYKLYYLTIIFLSLIIILYWILMYRNYWDLKHGRSR